MSPCIQQSGRTTPSAIDTSIQHIPFPFDLLRILPKCQQVELLFSTLKQGEICVTLHVGKLLDELYKMTLLLEQ